MLLLASCTRSSLPQSEGFFLPPTIAAQSTPLVLETNTALPPSPTPPCENHLVFLQDLSIPDGTVVTPGSTIEKIWQVRNEGSCTWGRGYTIKLEDGPALGLISRHPLPSAEAGETVEIEVQFTAPDQPGPYRSSWRAHDIGGQPFGVLIYIEIVVDNQ